MVSKSHVKPHLKKLGLFGEFKYSRHQQACKFSIDGRKTNDICIWIQLTNTHISE